MISEFDMNTTKLNPHMNVNVMTAQLDMNRLIDSRKISKERLITIKRTYGHVNRLPKNLEKRNYEYGQIPRISGG